MMDRHAANEGVIPSDMTPEIYIEIQSLQLAILLMSVCHVIVVVMDTMEADTTIRYQMTVAWNRSSCYRDDAVSLILGSYALLPL